MNNFFYKNLDYALFKKALRSTETEPVIINILSTDSSLNQNEDVKKTQVGRKNMSSQYQADSPFGKFFGPRKKRTEPLDMKDFSSWKNKNYRESEKQINDNDDTKETAFSFADYLKSKSKDETYNDEDKIKAELQKPIDQISIHDDDYKRFSLDSYLSKLEEQTKVQAEFSQTEDLVDNLDDFQSVVPTDEQDENFAEKSDVDIEDVALDESLEGERFSFEREELDKVKTRIEKIEREANNIKDKPTEKVIDGSELSGLTKTEDEGFNLDKLGVEDDVENLNKKLAENNTDDISSSLEDAPKVDHKRFFEVNVNKGYSLEKPNKETAEKDSIESDTKSADEFIDDIDIAETLAEESEKTEASDVEKTEKKETEETLKDAIDESSNETKTADENDSQVDSKDSIESQVDTDNSDNDIDEIDVVLDDTGENTINAETNEVLTKAEFKNLTDELINKFSALYKSNGSEQTTGKSDIQIDVQPDTQGVGGPTYVGVNPYSQDYTQTGYSQTMVQDPNYMGEYQPNNTDQIIQQQSALQTKIVELLETNKRNDDEMAEKLRIAEEEKQRAAEEYENRLRELEESIKKREEAARQEAYIEKLKNDIKLKKTETSYKLREEKLRKAEQKNSEKLFVKDKLKSELKNNLSVSNLEMDKKLLECVNKFNKSSKLIIKEPEIEPIEEDIAEIEDVEEIEDVKKPTPAKSRTQRTTRRKTTSSRTRTRAPRRKIDSDIIGGINFD